MVAERTCQEWKEKGDDRKKRDEGNSEIQRGGIDEEREGKKRDLLGSEGGGRGGGGGGSGRNLLR